MTDKLKISLFGLGKLGAPLAACFAAKGFRVIGVDTDTQKLKAIQERRAPVYEPGLQEMLEKYGERIVVTQDGLEAVRQTDVTFVVVPTPSERNGGFSLQFIVQACEQIKQALQSKDSYHLVVITSTVMPGAMDNVILPCLQGSNKHAGTDFGLCYGPEFIALGSAIHDFLNPDFLLIGESDARAGQLLASIYRQICDNEPSVARMSFANAELVKLAVNTFVTTKISFANMLARICEKQPGADVDVVTAALGLDKRIGGKYIKGAISYGGPCFPRDNLALTALAREIGAPADIASATDQFNRGQIQWLAQITAQQTPPGGTVGVLGLTYKPYTDVVEESPGLLLAQELVLQGVSVIAYDPAGNSNMAQALGEKVHLAATLAECVDKADVIVLATPWQEFSDLSATACARPGRPRVVIDCWRLLGKLKGCADIVYMPLGVGPPATADQVLSLADYRLPVGKEE